MLVKYRNVQVFSPSYVPSIQQFCQGTIEMEICNGAQDQGNQNTRTFVIMLIKMLQNMFVDKYKSWSLGFRNFEVKNDMFCILYVHYLIFLPLSLK